jgi:hypothetical protein
MGSNTENAKDRWGSRALSRMPRATTAAAFRERLRQEWKLEANMLGAPRSPDQGEILNLQSRMQGRFSRRQNHNVRQAGCGDSISLKNQQFE